MLFLNKKLFIFLIVIILFNISFSDEFNGLVINGSDRINSKYIYNELKFDKIKSTNKKIEAIKGVLDNCNFINRYNIDVTNGKIVINISEKKIVKKISFNGNKKIKDGDIKKIISVTDNSFFNKNILDGDIEKLKEVYNSLGLLMTDISYNVVETSDDCVDISININENTKTKIKNIKFVGNKNLSRKELYKKILSKENSFFQFGASKDFSTEKTEYDKYLLSILYRNKGFLDFSVESSYKISKDKKFAYIAYNIYEGTRYRVNNISINNDVRGFDESILLSNIRIKTNDYIDLELLEDRLKYINSILNENDLGFVSIIPDIIKASENSVDVIFHVKDAKKIYINKINIHGNYETYDYIIRNVIGISEGQLVNEDLINEARQNLISLGFLKNINIRKTPISNSNKVDIDIDFEEDKTGSVGVGFGYSTLDKFNINFNLKKTNLFGKLVNFDTDITSSKYRDSFSIGLGKPNIFSTKMFGGFNIYYYKNNYAKYSGLDFDERSRGIELYTKHRISSIVSQKFYYNLTQKINFNISDSYRNIIQEGNRTTSLFGTVLYYDTRDDLNYPLNGNYGVIDLGIAGVLGGSKKYIKTVGDFSSFFQIYKQLVFKAQIGGGYIASLTGNDLYPDDGFYVGGSKLRGFEFGSAGPRVINTNPSDENKSIGGTKYLVFNTELRLPIVRSDSFKIFGALFYNAGLTTGVERNKNVDINRILDSNKIRSSCGLAIILKTPAGNIGFEFSNIISKERYDETESFRFSLGTDF